MNFLDSFPIHIGNVLILSSCFLCNITCVVKGSSMARQLYHDLLTDYTATVRPRKNYSQAVDVELNFVLNQITFMDDANQSMQTASYLSAYWYDDYLIWDPSDYDGIEHIILPPTQVWLPDIVIINSVGALYEVYRKEYHVSVHHTGHISWSFGGTFTTMCPLDLSYFPFDRQSCDIQVENWAYVKEDVDLYIGDNEVTITDYRSNGMWELCGTEATKSTFYHDVHTNSSYPKVTFTLSLKRKPLFYAVSLLVPCFLILAVELGLFWMPPEAGEKVSVGITVIVAYTVFQVVLDSNTPKTSDNFPIMGQFVLFAMALASASVLISIFVLYIHHKGAQTHLPMYFKCFLFKYCARILCMRSVVPSGSLYVEDTFKNPPNSDEIKEECDDGLIFDPYSHGSDPFSQGSRVNKEIMDRLQSINCHVNILKEHLEKRQDEGKVVDEWKAAAQILDRCFFWIACIVGMAIVVLVLTSRDKAC